MTKDKILKSYDDLIDGKRQGKFALLLVVLLSTVISLSALTFAFLVQLKAIDTVKVIDSTGRVINTDTKRAEQVLKVSVQSHLTNLIHNLNSFDSGSIKENQAKTIFLLDRVSADRVFNSYKISGAYNDAIQGGVVYIGKMDKITFFEGENEPYSFELEGILEIKKGSEELKKLIRGKGKLRYVTPNFPNNVQGMQVYDYLQEFENIELENE